jgi:hypothetical protein
VGDRNPLELRLPGGVTAGPAFSQTHHQSGPFAGMVDRRVMVKVTIPF